MVPTKLEHLSVTLDKKIISTVLSLIDCICGLQAAIRKELNEFKSTEMDVHEESKQFTRYFH